MTNMKKEKLSLNKRITSSKFSFTKNFLYFLIVPAIILIVGIVLLSTIGFNLGTDFTGKSVVKIYINNEDSFGEEVESYNLDSQEDKDAIYDKIELVLSENGVKIDSFRTTTMTISDYNVYLGQAVEVTYQNISDDLDSITAKNSDIRNSLVTAFGYSSYDDAISSIDYSPSTADFGWITGTVASIVFGYLVFAIYMAFRYNPSIFLVGIIQIAIDLFLTLGLISIFRLTINMSLAIILISTFLLSAFNLFYYYSKIKSNIKSNKKKKAKNSVIADETIKEITFNRVIIYIALLVISVIFSALAVEGVREVALGIMTSLIVTFYTSQFLLPSFCSVFYKERKKAKTVKTKSPKKAEKVSE